GICSLEFSRFKITKLGVIKKGNFIGVWVFRVAPNQNSVHANLIKFRINLKHSFLTEFVKPALIDGAGKRADCN
ncbi:MAG: hypothetical protein ACM3Q2_00745, partial [Syntrophothermus sp.]